MKNCKVFANKNEKLKQNLLLCEIILYLYFGYIGNISLNTIIKAVFVF